MYAVSRYIIFFTAESGLMLPFCPTSPVAVHVVNINGVYMHVHVFLAITVVCVLRTTHVIPVSTLIATLMGEVGADTQEGKIRFFTHPGKNTTRHTLTYTPAKYLL